MAVIRVPIIILVLCVIAITITLLVGKLAKGKRVFKYIPSIISAFGGIGFYIKASFFSRSFEDIGFLLLAIAAGIFTVTSVVTAAVMDIFLRKKSLT